MLEKENDCNKLDTQSNISLKSKTNATLSHKNLLELTSSSLNTILSNDPLLSDLPTDVIVEEVQSLVAMEHGQAIRIFITRETEEELKVIIPNNVTVQELKNAVKRHFEIYQNRKRNKTKISWKYIWKTYDLSFDNIRLDDNNSSVLDYGVCNKSKLKFVKKLKRKEKYNH